MINPAGSLISFTPDGDDPAILAVEQIILSARIDELTRQEFTAELQQKVKEEDGGEAIFETNATNVRFQIFTGCGVQTPRPTIPDDAVLQDIFQRMDKVTLELKGSDSLPADLAVIDAIYKTHLAAYFKYETLRNYVKSDISIIKVEELKLEDYSFLTSTTLTIAAAALPGLSFANALLRKFVIDPTVETPNDAAASSSTVYQTWTAEVEVIAITYGENAAWEGL